MRCPRPRLQPSLLDDGEPDDGSWSYASGDGDCTADFQQSRLEEDSATPGDREASDALVALWSEDPDGFAPEDAVDQGFALGVPGNDLVAMRLIEGSASGGRSVTAARAFTGPLLGLAITVTCSTGDPLNALELLAAKSAIQVIP